MQAARRPITNTPKDSLAQVKRALDRLVQPPCPAEAIGQQLHRMDGAFSKNDAPEGEAAFELQLLDLDRRLSAELEWIKATSVRGVLVQAVALSSRLDDFEGLDGYESERALRSAHRLNDLIIGALIELAGVGSDELGISHRWRLNSESADVIAQVIGAPPVKITVD